MGTAGVKSVPKEIDKIGGRILEADLAILLLSQQPPHVLGSAPQTCAGVLGDGTSVPGKVQKNLKGSGEVCQNRSRAEMETKTAFLCPDVFAIFAKTILNRLITRGNPGYEARGGFGKVPLGGELL